MSFEGSKGISPADLGSYIRSASGAPHYEPAIVEDIERLTLEYRNRGFATATIEVAPKVSADQSRVDLTFEIVEGPQTIVDHILVVGNLRTDPKIILREIQLKAGAPWDSPP